MSEKTKYTPSDFQVISGMEVVGFETATHGLNESDFYHARNELHRVICLVHNERLGTACMRIDNRDVHIRDLHLWQGRVIIVVLALTAFIVGGIIL